MSDEELIEKASAVLWNHIVGEGTVGTDTFAACKRTAQLMLTVFREHTAPTDDEAWVDDDLYGVIDRAMRRSWTDTAEYEYAPSEITAAVRAWMDEQCFRRGAPAEPAVTDEMVERAVESRYPLLLTGTLGEYERRYGNYGEEARAIHQAQAKADMRAALEAALEVVTDDVRPEECCGKCPPLMRGGYDCTCKDNPRCKGGKHG